MSILGAVNLELVALLRERTSGWTILPVVMGKYTESAWPAKGPINQQYPYLIFQKAPLGQSYLDFYLGHPPQQNITFVLIKIPKHAHRALQLTLVENVVQIRYWRAYGWKQTFYLQSERGNQYIPDPEPGEIVYKLKQMGRLYEGRRGGWSVGLERLDLAHYDSKVADTIVQVLLKSYDIKGLPYRRWEYYRMGIGVNLDGNNMEYNDFYMAED